jgi:AraC-like DNA-binding protein
MSPHAHPLAALPFGEASAKAFDDVAACTDFLGRLPGAPSRFDAIGRAKDFRIRFRPVALPGLGLFAGSSSPKTVDHESARVAVVIPFGDCASVIRAGRREYRWASPHHAFFIPAGHHIEAESTAGAFVRLDIEASLLARTAAGMAGIGPRRRILALDEPRIVAMKAKGTDWLPMIRAICRTIDELGGDPVRLAAAGVDDSILRIVALMLQPERFLADDNEPSGQRKVDLAPLLERIMAGLAGRITMGDLESWSDRSARSIQMAFQKRFGMSPMQWIRERRLDLVRSRLLAATPETTVKEIAAACGISRMATFITDYTRRYGERPSETLRRGR